MAKVVKKKTVGQKKPILHIALTNKNYMIIGAGILLIILGYVFMSENSVDGFLPTVIAPILLVLGYCVVVPFGLLYKEKAEVIETVPEIAKPVGTSKVKSK